MNTTIFVIALYLAICCLVANMYAKDAVTICKPNGPVIGTILFIVVFLIAPLVLVYHFFQAMFQTFKKKANPKKKKRPQNVNELVIHLIRENLGLKQKECFRFDNQNNDDIYYFSESSLKKVQCGHIRESDVSLNWILNRECKIKKLTHNDVRTYLNTYRKAMGEKIE